MLDLISKERTSHLLSFATDKKVAFSVLLFERMIPELSSFTKSEGLEFSTFQLADEQFWLFLSNESSAYWPQLREDVLDAVPHPDTFGSLAAYFAFNAALVAAAIAEFLSDRQDGHIIEAIGYARDSLDANATNELDIVVYGNNVNTIVEAHPLVQRERRAEEEDILFLSTIQEKPWSANTVAQLKERAKTQLGMLSKRELKGPN